MKPSTARLALLVTGILALATPALAVEWERQLPLPQGQSLTDVILLDASTAVAVGAHGTILRTTDAGATWETTLFVNGIGEELTQVAAAGARLFILGENGVFLRSEDGGATWLNHTNPSANDPTAITFLDANTGYLACGGSLYRTDSGGLGWLSRPLPGAMSGMSFRAVAMATSQQIMAVGAGAALTFNDGGTWSDRSAFVPGGNDIDFYDETTAAVAYNQDVLLSTDYALTFNPVGSETEPGLVTGVRAVSPTTILFSTYYRQDIHPIGVGFRTYGHLKRTNDAGANWAQSWTGCGVAAIDYDTSGTTVAVGNAGQIHWSTDGGATWTQAGGNDAQFPWSAQAFLDEDTGVVLNSMTGLPSEFMTNLWRTGDGGATWALSTRWEALEDAAYVDASELYAVGSAQDLYSLRTGVVVRSIDGGGNWTRVYSKIIDDGGPPRLYRFLGVDVCDTGYGIAVGESDSLTVSGLDGEVITLSGATVTEQPRPGTGRLNDVSMWDCSNAVAVGDDGTVIVTADGGVSWSPGTSGTSEHLVAVACVGSSDAFAVGNAGTFLASADGGYTWTPHGVGTSEDVRDLSFVDALEGVVVAGNAVYRTVDGGASWTPDPVPTAATYIAACDYFGEDSYTVTAAGETETFAKRNPATAVRPRRQAPAFALEPNFPNPFNPVTTIRFVLPHAGPARLSVFDVAGRRVATLADGNMAAGPHAVRWTGLDDSGRAVASGVYFYRLETPSGTRARKMVLVK